MAISYVASGLAANNATSAAIPYPAGIAAGDLLLLTAVAKYSAYTSAPPSGFTLLREQVGGSGGTGVDVGDIRLATWYKIATGSESGTISVTKATQTGSVVLGRMFLLRRTAGSGWQVTATSGTDVAGGLSWSVTGAANLNLDAGDHVVMVSGMNTDAATYTAHALSASTGFGAFTYGFSTYGTARPAVTFGTFNTRQNAGTTTGDDVALVVVEGPVTSGPSSSPPTYTATASTGTPEGASIIIRIREARSIAADVGTYALTGNSAVIQGPAAVPNAWALGSWYAGAWYGTAWYESELKAMAAAYGSYTLTGQDASFKHTFRLAADTGSLFLWGQTVSPRHDALLHGEQGTYAVADQSANLNYHQNEVLPIAADQGAYTLSGQDATFHITRRTTAGIGDYFLTGQSVTLTPGAKKLAAVQGSYQVAMGDVNHIRSNVVGKAWAEGAWFADSWLGTAWAGDYTGLNNYTMPAESGSYDAVSIDASFKFGRHLDAATGTYVYTGDDALRDMLFHADEGAYALTGINARGGHGRPIGAASGGYSIAGQSARLLYGRTIQAQFGAYLVIGGDVSFTSGVGTALSVIPYTLTGYDATFKVDYRITAEAGSYALTGQDSNPVFGNVFAVETIPYQITGEPVVLDRTYRLLAGTGIYALTGMFRGRSIVAETGSYSTTFQEFSDLPSDVAMVRVYPKMDSIDGTWLPSEPNADLYAMIDDQNDADFDYADGLGTMRVSLGHMVDPRVNYGHAFTYRISGDGEHGVKVRVGAGGSTIVEYSHIPAPLGLTTYTQTLTHLQVDAFRAADGYSDGWLEFEAT